MNSKTIIFIVLGMVILWSGIRGSFSETLSAIFVPGNVAVTN